MNKDIIAHPFPKEKRLWKICSTFPAAIVQNQTVLSVELAAMRLYNMGRKYANETRKRRRAKYETVRDRQDIL